MTQLGRSFFAVAGGCERFKNLVHQGSVVLAIPAQYDSVLSLGHRDCHLATGGQGQRGSLRGSLRSFLQIECFICKEEGLRRSGEECDGEELELH